MNTYPKAKEDKTPFIMHGIDLNDPYQWMRNQHGEEVKAWVAKENNYTDTFFSNYTNTYEKYKARNSAKQSIPTYSNITKSPNGYTLTKHEGDAYILMEVNEAFEVLRTFENITNKHENTFFIGCAICPSDPDYGLFYGLEDGLDRPSVFMYDVKTETCLHRVNGTFNYMMDPLQKKAYSATSYVDKEKSITINGLVEYNFETKQAENIFTYHENAISVHPKQSEDGTQLVAEVMVDYSHNAIFFEVDRVFKPYNLKPMCVKYCGSTKEGHIILNCDTNEHGQIILVSNDLESENVLFESDEIFIQEVRLLNNEIYILAYKDVDSALYILKDNKLEPFAFPNMCSAEIISGNEGNQKEIFMMIESFTLPPQLYKVKDYKCLPVFKDSIEEDPNIIVEKVFYPSSEDKTMIPAYVIYPKGMKKDGNNKALMYAYGGYNNAMPPSYHNFFVGLDIVDWVKDGNMYVNINIRGGNEYGEKWHTDGYKLKKKNCYYDFIGVSEGLIKDNYTKPENIAICGGSNGGLLMCALLTMRPDLWGCVIASVPHTDMISFAFDDRGPMYVTEYGDPEDKEQFDYFLTYSPFHNVKKVNYPPIYIQTGECDNNVPPYHGKKMAARLQQYNTSENPILLRVLEKGSHDRGKGEVYIQTISEMQTFIELALNKKF